MLKIPVFIEKSEIYSNVCGPKCPFLEKTFVKQRVRGFCHLFRNDIVPVSKNINSPERCKECVEYEERS